MFQWINKLFERSLSPKDLRTIIFGPPTAAGVGISEETAMGINAVFRAISLKSSTIASLDKHVYRDSPTKGLIVQPRHPVSQLLADPNDSMNANKFWRAYITHVEASGNAFAEIERATDDQPIGLHLIHWRQVEIKQDADGEPIYYIRNTGKYIHRKDMLHTTGQSWLGFQGISPVQANREALGISVAAERHAASVFGNGAIPRGILKVKGVPDAVTKANLREIYKSQHAGLMNANEVGVFGDNTEFIETNMTPEDCQLLLTRAYSVEDVCRIWGVPPNLLFSGKQSYNANEEANVQFYELGLMPTLDNLEAEIDMKLLTRDERWRGYRVKYKVDALLRGVFQAKAKTYQGLVVSGIASQNEARVALGMVPKDQEGADDLHRPTNLQQAPDGEGNKEVEPAGKLPDSQQED